MRRASLGNSSVTQKYPVLRSNSKLIVVTKINRTIYRRRWCFLPYNTLFCLAAIIFGLLAFALFLTFQPPSSGPAAGVSDKANGDSAGLGKSKPFPWSDSALLWQRSAFHFQPEENWMNDPSGPLFYKGWYHLFYQYNEGAVRGVPHWAHAVSRDLIHWLHLPLAMVPDQWYDVDGVWTGSAIILPHGQIIMFFTSSTNETGQVQNLAYPADPSDPLLINWVKYPGNPVLFPPPGILPTFFRDPTTPWLTSDGKWRFLIGSKADKTGIALVYDTKDFKTFEKLDGLFHSVPNTGNWECLDLYPVSKTEENGLDTSINGPDIKHVLKTSLDDDRFDCYAIGTYHEKNATWVPDDPQIDVGIGLRYDYGYFFASKTFYDPGTRRRILWGYNPESDNELADVKKGWAAIQSIPRTILLDKKTGTHLLQWPVKEVESLRLSNNIYDKMEIKPGCMTKLVVPSATQMDIIAEFEINKNAVDKALESNETFSCSSSHGAAQRGALGPFGVSVLAYETLSEQTPVYFYIDKGNGGKLTTHFCSDQSRSSEAADVRKEIYGSNVPVLEGEKLSMRILVDHSIVESFAQGGRTCIVSRVYPTKAIYGDAKLFLFNNATDASVTASLKIWQMDSAYIRPYE